MQAANNPGIKTLVIDFRNNTGGSVETMSALLDFMTPKGTELFEFHSKNTKQLGEPTAVTKVISEGKYCGNGEKFDGNVFPPSWYA
ncbi:MAG: hypothetical protein LBT36_03735 [Oscillospiraceae bacterium]|nr:hypothetical protein [Oscillospiraceae bacterium]